MRGLRMASELDFAQAERQRNRSDRKSGQHPEDVDIGEIGRLRLHLLGDPRQGLLVGRWRQTAVGEKIVRRLLQGMLILRARRNRVLDEAALVELLAVL